MSYTIKNIFKWYKKKYKNTVKSETEFRRIWGDYMELVTKEILLEGGFIKLPGRMGDFRVVRKERDPRKLMPNWGATNAAKKDGTYTGIIYFTDSMWVRYLWRKSRCYVKNKSIWHFRPTRGEKGLKTKLTQKMAEDEFAYLNFIEHGRL